MAAVLTSLCLTAGAARAREACEAGPSLDAARNAASLDTLAWAPFRRPEVGWDVYEPLAAREIGTTCPATSPGFAAALSRWRRGEGLGESGAMDLATLGAMTRLWQARRPFVTASRHACPPPPDPASLARARGDEAYGGKVALLAADTLGAYRAMVRAARVEVPQVAADRRLMTMFSAYRDPDADAARCARELNCQGITRAACSAHRTGLAIDLYLGAAPGLPVDSADDVNRRFIARAAAYRWLVVNAARFGFVNYPFEPWHWEWTGGGAESPAQHLRP